MSPAPRAAGKVVVALVYSWLTPPGCMMSPAPRPAGVLAFALIDFWG